MLRRLALACVLVASAAIPASADIVIHATCAAAVPRDPAQLSLLRSTLAREIARRHGARTVTIDVSIARMHAQTVRGELQVRVEVTAASSDGAGRMRKTSTATAIATGRPRDAALLHRDAIEAAATKIAASL